MRKFRSINHNNIQLIRQFMCTFKDKLNLINDMVVFRTSQNNTTNIP